MKSKFLYIIIALLVVFTILAFFLFLSDKPNTQLPNNSNKPTGLAEAYKDCVRNFPQELCGMFSVETRADLYKVCSTFEAPSTELDTTLYPDNKLAVVRWQRGEDYITTYLPYETEADFNGCSESAKILLKHIQESTPQ